MSLHALPNSPADSDQSPVLNNSPGNLVAHLDGAPTAQRRKPSRRANTAERRATHNAVERQRRETLNGRFLDLAGLLPNLSSVRRPSKSAIVNSSIALVHSQRRARVAASRELRTLKSEADALRRELNEWRERSSVPRVEEPARSAEFTALLNAEEEEFEPVDRRAYYDVREEDDDLDQEDDFGLASADLQPVAAAQTAPGARGLAIQTSFDPAAALYDTHLSTPDADKVAAWNAHMFSALAQSQQQQQQQQQLLAAHRQSWNQQAQAALFASAQSPASVNSLFSANQAAFYAPRQLAMFGGSPVGSGTHSPELAHHSPHAGSPLGVPEDEVASVHSGHDSARSSPPATGIRSASNSSIASSASSGVITPYETMSFNLGLAIPETTTTPPPSARVPSSNWFGKQQGVPAYDLSAQYGLTMAMQPPSMGLHSTAVGGAFPQHVALMM